MFRQRKARKARREAMKAVQEARRQLTRWLEVAPEAADEVRIALHQAELRQHTVSLLYGQITALTTAINCFERDDPRREGMVIQRANLEDLLEHERRLLTTH